MNEEKTKYMAMWKTDKSESKLRVNLNENLKYYFEEVLQFYYLRVTVTNKNKKKNRNREENGKRKQSSRCNDGHVKIKLPLEIGRQPTEPNCGY